MKMFGLKRKNAKLDVHPVVQGVVKPLQEVEDEMFAKGLVGNGIAIVPNQNTILSPIDGTLTAVFPTGHAFGITSESGLEFLIHVGINTVSLKGEGFKLLVEQGLEIKSGEPLVTVDFDFLKSKGIPTDTMVILTTDASTCDIENQMEKGTIISDPKLVLFTCVKK